MSTSRRWCFTLNNWSPQELDLLTAQSCWSCCYIGAESGESNTPHLQGYLETPKRITLQSLKSQLNLPRIHLEVARGTAAQNLTYCSKESLIFEKGTPMRQGKRSDLDEVVDKINSGATLRTLWKENSKTMILHHRGISIAYQKLSPNTQSTNLTHPIESFSWNLILDWTKTQVFWGASGVGKTSYALALLPKALVVSHLDDLLKFDEEIHTGIIFDDISICHLPRESQIHITDQDLHRSIHCRYMTATIPCNTKKIFTTNIEYGQCMNVTDSAIRRRIQITNLVNVLSVG